MNHPTYAKIPALNWTRLKILRDRSPYHFHYFSDHESDDTTGRMLGRATHALVFEPDTFYARHAIYDGPRRAGKEWDAFVIANADKEILKRSEVADLLDQAEAIRNHPLVAPYLAEGESEQVVQWTDPVTGLPCKARLDRTSGRSLIDLKGAPTTHPNRFGSIAAKQGYHIQLGGHYYNACKYGLGWEPEEVAIVAVEFNRPFDVAVFTLDESDIALAQDEIAELLAKAKECLSRGSYPGHGTDEFDEWTVAKRRISLPRWAWGSDDDVDADELEEMGFAPKDEE